MIFGSFETSVEYVEANRTEAGKMERALRCGIISAVEYAEWVAGQATECRELLAQIVR